MQLLTPESVYCLYNRMTSVTTAPLIAGTLCASSSSHTHKAPISYRSRRTTGLTLPLILSSFFEQKEMVDSFTP